MKRLFAFILAAAALISCASDSFEKALVKVEGGYVQGLADGEMKIFKGIPFAAPPVGDLRWKAPQPVVPWDGVRDALEFGPSPVVLLIDPIDGNRFRVCSGRMIHLPNWSYALLSAAATLAAVTLHPAAVVATLLVSGAMVAVAVRKRLRMRNS